MAIVKGSSRQGLTVSQKRGEQKSLLPQMGSKRLYRPNVSKADLLYNHSRRKTKSLISLLMGHSVRIERLAEPRAHVRLRALTPTGAPAVKIRLH